MKKIIIILDFVSGTTNVHEIEDMDEKTGADELVTQLGYDESNCQYMITNQPIEYHHDTNI